MEKNFTIRKFLIFFFTYTGESKTYFNSNRYDCAYISEKKYRETT